MKIHTSLKGESGEMGMFYGFVFVIYTVTLNDLTFATVVGCGQGCGACTVKLTSVDVIVTCSGSNITKVPDDLSANTTKL